MTVLRSEKILQEKNTSDPSSITSLTLTHRALSDVSCLSEFKNLERLDLSFNNLTSLEGLKSCVNLKWLSVVQNKLQSLKGIEGLTRLTVLNAGKNKLKSMDGVKSLVSLCALILNENEISSICKLNQIKELNTLVLSRNPINSIGDSLVKLKSITKVLPSDFAHLVKLQNLDMGNNLISNWSNLKVLSSLVNLKNLNLRGNPVAEREKLVKKVKKLLPNLHIFNARPIDKVVRDEVDERAEDFLVGAGNKVKHQDVSKIDPSLRNKKSKKARLSSEIMDSHPKSKEPWDDSKAVDSAEDTSISERRMKKKLKLQQYENRITNNADPVNENPDEAIKSKHKEKKMDQLAKEPGGKSDIALTDNEPDKKSRKKIKRDNLHVMDSAETPFVDLFAASQVDFPTDTGDIKLDHKIGRNIDSVSGLVTLTTKKKKRKRAVDPATFQLSQGDEIGLGGPSAWN